MELRMKLFLEFENLKNKKKKGKEREEEMTRDMKNLQLVREQIERVKQDLQDGIAKEKILNSLHYIDLSLKNIVLSLSQEEIRRVSK